MDFYKIIRDSTVVGVGQMFLRWYPSKHDFYYCDIDDAERVQDIVTETLYHADWLRDAPSGADAAPEAEVIQISAVEYDELYEQLRDGEEIPALEPDPGQEPEPVPVAEPEPEDRPMSVQEMREKIEELDEMLNIIMGVVE